MSESSSVDSTIWLSSQTNYFDDPVRSKRYPKAKLAQLYHLRWQATEVNFKHLKTTLNMEMIWAKSPQMVRKNLDASTGLQFAAKLDVDIG